MSDAVGYNWVDHIKDYCEKLITDEEFENIRAKANGHVVPTTKEEAVYREFFWESFGTKSDRVITEIWRPRWTAVTDPSARNLQFFQESH